MDFLSLCQRVRQETGISDSGPSQVTGQTGDFKRIVDWTNEAFMRLQSYRDDWNWLWTTDSISIAEGEAVYSVPSTMANIIVESVYANGVRLDPVAYSDYRAHNQTIDSGTATAFTIRPDGRIALNALPDAALTMTFEGYREPSYFAEGISVPPFKSRYHMVIVWDALMEYALFDEAPELFQKAKANYDELLAELVADTLPEIKAAGSIV